MPPTKRSMATTSSTSDLANPTIAAGMFRRTITVTDGTPSSSSASSASATTTYLELTQDECRMLRSSSSVASQQQHSSPAPSHLHSTERLKPTNSVSSSSSLVSSTTTVPPSYEDQKGGAGGRGGEVFLALPCVYCGRWVSTRLRTTAELLSLKSAVRIDYHPEHHDAEQTTTPQQQKDENGAPLRVRRSSTLFDQKEGGGSGSGAENVAVKDAKGKTTLNPHHHHHHDEESLWMPSDVSCQWMYCLLSRPPPTRPPPSSSLGQQTYATSSKDDDDIEIASAPLATTAVEGGGDAVGAGGGAANLPGSVSNELAGVVVELPKTVASPALPFSPDACAGSRLPTNSAAFIACVHQPPPSCTSSTTAATSSASEAAKTTEATLSGAWTSERDSIRSQNSSLIERMRQLKDERRQRGLALLNLDVLTHKEEKKRRRDAAQEEEEKTHPTTTVVSSSTSSPSFPTMMQEYLGQLNQQLDTLAVFPSMTATTTSSTSFSSLSVAAPVATRGRKPLSELPAVQTDALGLFACCSLCGKWRRVSRPFPATEGFLCAASSWSLNHNSRSDATTVSRDLSMSMSSRLRMMRMSCEVPEVPSLMTAMLLVQGALWKGALKRLTVARKRVQPLTLLGATRAVSKRAREGVNHDGRVAPPTAAPPGPAPQHPSSRSQSSSSSSQPKGVPPSRPAVERTPSSSSAAQPQPGERIKGGRQQQQLAKQEGIDATTHRRRMTHREEVNVVVHTPTEDEETRSTAALRAAIINLPEENGKPETKETSRRPTAKNIAHPESGCHEAEQQEIIISSHRKRGRPTTTKKPEEPEEEQKRGEQHEEEDQPIDRRRRHKIEAESVAVVAASLSVDDDGVEEAPHSAKTKRLSMTTHDDVDEQQQERQQQQRRSSRERIRSPAEIEAPAATRRRQRQEESHELPAKRTPPRETATTTKKGAKHTDKKAADETDRVAADDTADREEEEEEDEEDRQYWVQCDDCSKWRILRQKLDESSVSKWTCTSSPVPGTTCRTSCDTRRQSAVLRILFS